MMLEIRDLHVKFHTRDREAVAGVSFTIHDGEIQPSIRFVKGAMPYATTRPATPNPMEAGTQTRPCIFNGISL